MRSVVRTSDAAHPGQFVKSNIVEANGLSVTDAALVLGVTRPTLSALLNGRAHLSPEMALRIEKAFGIPLDRLMHMQNRFDIAMVRQRENEIDVVPFRARSAPASERDTHGDDD